MHFMSLYSLKLIQTHTTRIYHMENNLPLQRSRDEGHIFDWITFSALYLQNNHLFHFLFRIKTRLRLFRCHQKKTDRRCYTKRLFPLYSFNGL